MRSLFALLALTVAVATGSAQPSPPAAVPGEALFVVSGKGYGHGVGMSQYGAYGMAKAGHTYDEILQHYYTGIELGTAPAREVRVLLAEGRRAVTIASTVPFTIRDAAGTIQRLPAGPLTFRADLELPTDEGPVSAVSPLVVRPGKAAPLSLDGRLYRGRLQVSAEDGFLRVVNFVALESYLQGVVAGEMPHSWPSDALRAQAVAARSYALANLVKGKPFDLYADVRSQVYFGVAGEKPSTTEAVQATAGEVVLYAGRVASTLYFSSSGGKTASAIDVFGVAVPYLASRPDPWDKLSPYHRWGPVLLGARTVQAKLGVEARVLDATPTTTPSGRIRSLAVQTTKGTEAVPASLVRTALGLRSTWLTVGVLRLDRPAGPVVFGSSVQLTGVSRGVMAPRLAWSASGEVWDQASALDREPNGGFSATVKPTRTTRYRLEVGGAASPALLLQVVPRLQLSQPAEPGVLAGTVRPKLGGTVVSIELRSGSSWNPVAQATVDDSGAFRAALTLVPGSYRARIPATDGLAAGVSPSLEVTG
ncbi:MAG TPA: SpoIID/LytB domain-containing protein [Gaiellaceae bacterium]|nr:SpoIID/LytB domain-containing protein [Gaiellaceae bacterium]